MKTWYPPGEVVVMHALELAGYYGTPTRALKALEEQRAKMQGSPFSDRALYELGRVEMILSFWKDHYARKIKK